MKEKTKKPKLLINYTGNEKLIGYVNKVIETEDNLTIKAQLTKEFMHELKFNQLLNEAKAKGYTQKQLVALLGYKSEARFSNYKTGKKQPTARLIINFERLLKSLK